MKLRLKDNYIVQMSPCKTMLIDVEDDTHIEISRLEGLILGQLDGTGSKETLVEWAVRKLHLLEQSDVEMISKNIGIIVAHFTDYIEMTDQKNLRNQVMYGSEEFNVPFSLSLEITNKCILKCKHCYKEAGIDNESFVDKEKLISFLRKCVGKVYSVQLTGGEAMLHPDFFEILAFCKKEFPLVSVSTTGILINENNVENFDGTRVYLSLYSFDRIKNESYVGYDVLDKVIYAAELLRRKHVHVCINTIVSDKNIGQLGEFLENCIALSVNGIGVGKVTKVGRAKRLDDNEFCSMQCEACVREIETAYKARTSYLSTFVSYDIPKNLKCGYYKWVVNEQGEILPCAFFPRSFLIGTIDDELEEIFTEEKFYRMVSHLKLWADLLKQKNDSITEICEVLKLVEAME